jgi:hypothetical protein
MIIKIDLTPEEFARLAVWLVSTGNIWTTYFGCEQSKPSGERYTYRGELVTLLKSAHERNNYKQLVELEFPDRFAVNSILEAEDKQVYLRLENWGASEVAWRKGDISELPEHLRCEAIYWSCLTQLRFSGVCSRQFVEKLLNGDFV